jgi:hypothetical protein
VKLLCNRLFRSVYNGRGGGEIRTHGSTAAFLATLYLVNDTNGDDDSLIKRQLPKDTGPGSPGQGQGLRGYALNATDEAPVSGDAVVSA